MRTGRVLVLGATGLLGGTLVPTLSNAGFDVVRHGRHHHVDLVDVHGDLTDPRATASLLQAVQPEAVVNLAALSSVDECEQHPHNAYVSNVLTAANVARAAEALSEIHVVHLSTDQVYDGVGPHIESQLMICNTYAQTKRAAELLFRHCNATILRTNFFGPSVVPHRKTLSDWVIENLRANRPIPVFHDVLFSPLTMKTLSGVICELIGRGPSGILNAGSREGASKADFAMGIASMAALPHSLLVPTSSDAVRSRRARRPKDMRMTVSAIERVLGRPMPTLAEEIATLA